jgi:pheromone shutdown protein TraB
LNLFNFKDKKGGEFKKAYEKAVELNIPFSLIDRPVNVTLNRIWGFLSFYSKIKFIFLLISATFFNISQEDIEKLKDEDMITMAMKELSAQFPEISTVLIDERDSFMTLNILKLLQKLKSQRKSSIHTKKLDIQNLEQELFILQQKMEEEDVLEVPEDHEIYGDEIMIETDEITEKHDDKDVVEFLKSEIEQEKEILENLENEEHSMVVVIGKGHQNGILNLLQNRNQIKKPKEIPSPSTFPYFKLSFISIFLFFIYKFFFK